MTALSITRTPIPLINDLRKIKERSIFKSREGMKSVDTETIKTTSTMNQTNENWAVIVALKRNSSYFN